ncbi:MAG: HD domain-containing protein [Cardiobacteriaceae bacterium]|nr:HD domain-containing protein [Cardiobacteriaceae bacterium]
MRRLHRASQGMDKQQSALFHQHFSPSHPQAWLYAIGGYGRRELFPCSDVDLLLITDAPDDTCVSAWIADLWRLGRVVAPRVCTLAQLEDDVLHDITLLTSLLDARLITQTPQSALPPSLPQRPLPAMDFIEAKLAEQAQRDRRAGKLEPNIKTDVGGLRDLHTIHWLNRYTYPHNPPRWLSSQDNQRLKESRHGLFQIRLALHHLSPKSHDTLHFAEQITLAKALFSQESNPQTAVERFMQIYYRHTYRIRQLNQYVCDSILDAQQPKSSRYKALCSQETLPTTPQKLWHYLVQRQQNGEKLPTPIAHQLYQSRDQLITPHNLHEHVQGFYQGLKHQGKVYAWLEMLHGYGLLHRLIPDFWTTVGRMQFDLFHAYTVDHHSVRLAYYLDHFAQHDDPRYPIAHQLMHNHPNPAPLYFAALTHDIGKGLSGAHEEVGASLMEAFLKRFSWIDTQEIQHTVRLIRAHLLLSTTAQKKDLQDPKVIADFATQIPNRAFLNDLYLLTLADISATNQNLWNDWKAHLMHQLYQHTAHYLEHQALQTPNPTAPNPEIQALWKNLPAPFFQHESPQSLHTKTQALIALSEQQHYATLLDTQRLLVLSRAPQMPLFSQITHFLEQHGCHIFEARIYQTLNQAITLHEYTLSQLPNPKALCEHLYQNTPLTLKKRRPRTQLRYFNPHTIITLKHAPHQSYLELQCKDQHGLLSQVSRVFLAQNLTVIHAKISTFGERVEDHFTLTNAQKTRLSDWESHQLQSALAATLESFSTKRPQD